jgi:hypothetical protein
MKKALIVVLVVIVAIALLISFASSFRNPKAVATSAAQPWPGGMGTLDSLPARLPARQASASAVKLTELANALPKNEALDQYVASQMARGELTIGEPPALPDVSAIRELLLGQEVVWPRPGGVGEIGDHETSARRVVLMTLSRALIASALTKARGNDPTAWDDLRALNNLARSVDGQPQVMEQTAAFAMVRMINAAAWKMPLPAPAWLGELQQRDAVRRLLEAFQYQVASYWESGVQVFPTKMLADSVEHDRRIAEALINETRCDLTPPHNKLGVDLAFVWRRAFRYRAEREASANALRVREGRPIESASRCSDGAWTYDGTTLRFSREIGTAPPDTPMPLVLQVKP